MNYYICVCNSKNYRYDDDTSYKWRSYNPDNGNGRKCKKVFLAMQEGDRVLCYQSKSKRKISALLEVESKTKDGVSLKFIEPLEVSLDVIKQNYADIFKCNAQEYSPFTETQSNMFNGTFFDTTKEQFELLISLDSLKHEKEIQAHKIGSKAESIFQNNYHKIPLFENKKL